MDKMKNHRIRSHEYGEIDLSPYQRGTAWMEVNNSDGGGFFVLSPDTARELAEKLLEWANSAPSPHKEVEG